MHTHARTASLLLVLAGCGASPTTLVDAASTDGGSIADGGRDSGLDAAVVLVDAGAATAGDAALSSDAAGDAYRPGFTDRLLRHTDFAACESFASLTPRLPDEMNHLVAARLSPTSYPFTAREIGYFLELSSEDGQCKPGLAHRVDLYVSLDGAPPDDPGTALVQSIDVPAAIGPFETVGNARVLRHVLEEPIVLAGGTHLYVVVQLTAGAPDELGNPRESLCASGCRSVGTERTLFWSNAATAPYAWTDLITGAGHDFVIGAWASSVVE